MAGSFPHPRAAPRAAWPRELQRGALLLGASAALFWSSFAVGRWIVDAPSLGPIYLDLVLAWLSIVVHMSAWPDLWVGLRDLRAQRLWNGNAILPWRAFLLTLALIVAALIVVPLQYHATVSADAWTFLVYVTAFPYLGWTFVPVLALHGILFGRVANYASPRSQYLIDAGVLLLFAVAAATTAVILQNPGATAFVRSWSVGRGILPAAALSGYALIAVGLTVRPAPVRPRVRTWTPQRIR